MNCEEVSHQLTDYLDKSLDTATTTRIATHIISCALCRAESNDFADCIHQVSALPELDPPLGFAQRVMAHIHDSEPQTSLWQRMIRPLLNGLPLRASATAAVAIFAIALYQWQQPLKQNSDVNLALRADSPVTNKEKTSAPTAAKTPQIKESLNTTVEMPLAAAKLTAVETTLRAAPTIAPQPAAPAAKQSESEIPVEEKIETPKRPPLRVQEVTAARDSRPVVSDPRAFGGPVALRQAAPMMLERPVPIGDRATDFEFVVRRRSAQRRDTIEHLGSVESERAPSAAATGKARIESIAEIRFYNVAPEHFEVFKKELASEANIELEPKTTAKEIDAAKQADRQLLVKVTILPAESPAR